MAAESPAGRIFAFALLAVSVVISYQAWTNSKLSPEVLQLAKQHACDLDSSCIVMDEQARVGRADVVRQRFEFNTTHGMMTVTCQRELVFFGGWKCTPEKGRLVTDPIP